MSPRPSCVTPDPETFLPTGPLLTGPGSAAVQSLCSTKEKYVGSSFGRPADGNMEKKKKK